MPKRKLEDAGTDAEPSKRPKRDKSKYNKNVDPNSTKEERKAARKAARNKRRADRVKARETETDEQKAKRARKLEKLMDKKLPKSKKNASKSAVKSEQTQVNGDGEEPSTETTGMDAKSRRKALRKAQRLANKGKPKEDVADGDEDEDAAQANGVEDSAMDVDDGSFIPFEEPEPVKASKPVKDKKSTKTSKAKPEEVESTATKEVIAEESNTTSPAETRKDERTSSSGYAEHPELSALSTDDISQFLSSKQITVKDADPELRPITSFAYLPSLDAATSPFDGFTSPTPIQAATWPYLLAGRDIIGVAETGSGKTLAFGVPCIHKLMALKKKERKVIKACIVSPTRELALQIQEQLSKFSKPYGLKVTCVYGGVSKDAQREELKGTNIVVATPGRLNDFIQEGSIDLSHADYLVLDEADRMLDKGFEEEVRKIASNTAQQNRQTLMFTATWPQSVRDLAASFMTKPVRVLIGDNTTGELRANTRIVQEVEVIDPREKQQRLFQLLKQYQSGKNKNDRILVFCLYKKEATRIEEFIRYKGFNVAGIHGDLNQQKRTESLEAFKNGSVPLLVATDVAARGLDIPAVKLVINVTFPLTAEDYVHRIGRTGRAGQDGKAITLFTEEEKGLAGALINVLKAANQPVPEELLKFGTTVKRKAHDAYGAFYKDPSEMKKATKITFD